MRNTILDLATKLISIPSTPDNSEALNSCLEIIKKELSAFNIKYFESNNYKSILVYNKKELPKKFRIILNAHLDIIPAKEYQYNPIIKGDKLYGAGAMDMKANLSCLVYLFKELANSLKYPIGLQIVTDEEVGGFNGTKYQLDSGIRSDFVIAAESTQFNIVNQAKGVIWASIHTKGITAHGAYPWKGKNAILEANTIIGKIENEFPLPVDNEWISTVNISEISTTNKSFNKIPDNCKINLDVRYIPEDEKNIITKLNRIANNPTKIEFLAKEPALNTSTTHQDLVDLQNIAQQIIKKPIIFYGANGSSDARHYSKFKTPSIEFGPIGGGIGSDKEWVSISSLDKYYSILKKYLLKINT